MKRTFFAPGKLILFGEYAVLEGAPALTAAVTRGIRLTATHTGDARTLYRAPALAGEAVATLLPELEGPSSLTGLPRAILETLEAAHVDLEGAQGWTLTADIGDMMAETDAGTIKLGLGSSAASTVALTGALLSLAGAPLTELTELSLEAHWRLQDGKGSGADVAASAIGGLVLYQRGEQARRERVEHAHLPSFLPVFLGQSASTPEMLEVLRGYAERKPAEYRARMSRLEALALAATQLSKDDDALELVRTIDAELEALGEAAGLAIVIEAHRTLRAMANAEGLAVKPCGAGGGDFSLVFGDPDALEGLTHALKRVKALTPIPMALSHEGFVEG